MNFNGRRLFPNEKTAPLSWVIYGLFGIIFVPIGLIGYIDMFLALVVRPEESVWLKILISFSMLILPAALAGLFCYSNSANLKFLLLLLIVSSFFVGFMASALGAHEELELFGMAPFLLWIGIYNFTRVPVSIRERRMKRHEVRRWL